MTRLIRIVKLVVAIACIIFLVWAMAFLVFRTDQRF